MKISFGNKTKVEYRRGEYIPFTIQSAILKTHFKQLMNLSTKYESSTKKGFISIENEQEFKILCEKIEKSDDKKCEKSYEKSKEIYINKKANIGFEDYCEDYLDVNLGLMSDKEKTEAYKSYKEF